MLNDLDLMEQMACHEARASFWAFRQYINHGKMKLGWWQKEVATELQQFYSDFVNGKAPQLVIQAPPQHGKSAQIIDFVAWLSGHNPDKQIIYTSFSERLGVRANLRLQRIFDSRKYQMIFPGTSINKSSTSNPGQYLRNREVLEFIEKDGLFRNTTVRGAITGETLDCGIIDDPIKGREEANSLTIRDKTWEWFTYDFLTRFSQDAGLLVILTRWHVDDPIGRLIAINPSLKVLSYPAIAIRDEKHRKAGEALFPEHKSLDFLLRQKETMGSASFEALYQQNPTEQGGNLIKSAYFKICTQLPSVTYRVIYADTAQKTKEANDYTVFQCWGKMTSGDIILLDQVRGKWDSVDLEIQAIAFWNKHSFKVNGFDPDALGKLRAMKVEDKVSGTGLIQKIKRETQIPIFAIQRNIDKYTRLCDNLGYIESGRVWLPADAPWLSVFLAECEQFQADMGHSFDDQIDPMLDAIEDMLVTKRVSFYE